MKLVLLGTGGYFPTSRRQTACMMLPEIGVVLDAGTGMYRLGQYLQTDRLDIFLSHVHLDHIAGLTCLINVVPPDVLTRTTVHGDEAKLKAVREHLFANDIFPVPPSFRFEPLRKDFPLPGGGTLSYFPLEHPGGSIGYRLDWPDRSLAYVTDTMAVAGASYIDQIRGVDLLVHESYFPHDVEDLAKLTGHSWLASVTARSRAQVGRLVLAHIDPQLENDAAFDLDSARRTIGDVEIARDEMVLEF